MEQRETVRRNEWQKNTAMHCKPPFPIPSVPLGGVEGTEVKLGKGDGLMIVILIISTQNYFN